MRELARSLTSSPSKINRLVDHEQRSSRSSGSQDSAGEARNGPACDGVRPADLDCARSPGWVAAAGVFLRVADAVATAISGEVRHRFLARSRTPGPHRLLVTFVNKLDAGGFRAQRYLCAT